MRIGWRTYLKQKFQPKSSYYSLGLSVSPEMVTFTVLKKEGQTVLLTIEETVSASNWKSHLKTFVEKHKLGGTPCFASFSQHWYQIFQLDSPKVEKSEIQAALVWSVNELLGSDMPMAIDYYDMPVAVAGSKKINVIAIPEKEIETVVEHCLHAGVNLKGISAEELALCELLPLQDDAVLTLVQEAGAEIILNIVQKGQLFVSRRLKGFENLGSFSPDELRMGLADSLSIQIQRSMDYFESQLRQPPVRKVLLRLNTAHLDLLSEQIRQVVQTSVEPLKPIIPLGPATAWEQVNLPSLGAAMSPLSANREEV